LKNFFKRVWKFIWKSALIFIIASVVSVIIFRWLPVPVTPLMLLRCLEQKWDGKEMKLEKKWVPIEKISNQLALAVVCSEDQNFLKHSGFDFEAIDKALTYNENHKKKRGASTISQQTAKNLFLWPGRSWIRKGFETYFTFLIEVFWSKERIMEVYLNIIETGNGIYGAQASAQVFFNKDAFKLSKSEVALIAAVLPNPRKFSAKKPSAYILKRQTWVMNQMSFWGGKITLETN
jgi:monofunctional biosynthetic peptidoglycan transglycosylase